MTVADAEKLHKFLKKENKAGVLPKVGDPNAPIPNVAYRINAISMFERMLETKAPNQKNIVLLLTVVLQTAIRYENLYAIECKSNSRLSLEVFRKEQTDVLYGIMNLFPREFNLAARLVAHYAAPGLIKSPVAA